jgi:sugar O-acyltransferase (sialic acid O-acetyltransferase NeuD family)
MQKIIIIGNAIAAEILYGYLKNDMRYEVVAFSANKQYLSEKQLFNIDVVDFEILKEKYSINEYKIILGMGYSNLSKDRTKMFQKVKELGYEIETYLHPDAKIYNENNIGEGSIVLANSVIEPYSIVGINSVIWANCTIAHHSVIEDNCWIASGSVIAGEAKIKSNCFLGVNATIVDKIIVESFNIVGANTMISKNTKPNEVYLSRNGEKHRFGANDYVQYFGV